MGLDISQLTKAFFYKSLLVTFDLSLITKGFVQFACIMT